MAEISDYIADIRKYTAKVDEAAVAGMARTYALAMSKADTRTVAATDAEEVKRVVSNFLVKKLGRKEAEADLLAATKGVLETMKDARNKSRLTVYYLLAEKYKALEAFK